MKITRETRKTTKIEHERFVVVISTLSEERAGSAPRTSIDAQLGGSILAIRPADVAILASLFRIAEREIETTRDAPDPSAGGAPMIDTTGGLPPLKASIS